MRHNILMAVVSLGVILSFCGCTARVEEETTTSFISSNPSFDVQQEFHYDNSGSLTAIDVKITPKEGFTEDTLTDYTNGEFTSEDFSKDEEDNYTLHVTEGKSFDIYKDMSKEDIKDAFDMLEEVEEQYEIPEGRPSLMVGNLWFMDISDGFEVMLPGSLTYNVMQVYHYNDDESLKELDIVIVPLDGFNISDVESSYAISDFMKTEQGHYVLPLTSGELFNNAAITNRTEARETLYDLWYKFAMSLLR